IRDPLVTGVQTCALPIFNALRGLPTHSTEPLVTQRTLLDAVDNRMWAEATAERGAGVRWEEFERYLRLSLEAFKLNAEVEILRRSEERRVGKGCVVRWSA